MVSVIRSYIYIYILVLKKIYIFLCTIDKNIFKNLNLVNRNNYFVYALYMRKQKNSVQLYVCTENLPVVHRN